MLSTGLALCLSQILVQLQHGEPSIAMLTAGAGLLAGYPLLKVGDRRADGDDDGRQDHPDTRPLP